MIHRRYNWPTCVADLGVEGPGERKVQKTESFWKATEDRASDPGGGGGLVG